MKSKAMVRIDKAVIRHWRAVPRRVWPVPADEICPERIHCWVTEGEVLGEDFER